MGVGDSTETRGGATPLGANSQNGGVNALVFNAPNEMVSDTADGGGSLQYWVEERFLSGSRTDTTRTVNTTRLRVVNRDNNPFSIPIPEFGGGVIREPQAHRNNLERDTVVTIHTPIQRRTILLSDGTELALSGPASVGLIRVSRWDEASRQVGRIAISSGHGGVLRPNGEFYDPGAVCTIGDGRIEAVENRRVVAEVARLLRLMSNIVVTEIHANETTTPAAELIRLHNAVGERDLDVQIHFNSTAGAVGVETIHYDNRTDDELSGRKVAERISNAIVNVSDLILRDIPPRYNGSIYMPRLGRTLGFLTNSEENRRGAVAVMPEICFINTPSDMAAYDASFYPVCQAIAEELASTARAIATNRA